MLYEKMTHTQITQNYTKNHIYKDNDIYAMKYDEICPYIVLIAGHK